MTCKKHNLNGCGQVCMPACRDADLETILATDLSQLGQVPKLQALAISALRSKLLIELEQLLRTIQVRGEEMSSAKKEKVDDGETSQRSFILDGSPKSMRPNEVPLFHDLSSVQLQCLEVASASRSPCLARPMTPLMHDSMVCCP
jgi:hypothetical protein